ncbi:MAG: hypothetical protein E7618_08235 [Ruminococcaceae bacterium]|nr:hypothetical protein [Oscillospiraceae bacterium]
MDVWGWFGIAHLVSLIVAALIIFGLYFLLKNRRDTTKWIVLGILSFSGIAAIIFNLVMWDSPLEYLPLHLCSINAILLPIAIFTRSRIIGNMLLLWSVGALFANLMTFLPTEASDLYGATFLFFYLPHIFEFGIPILLFKFGYFKKEVKYIATTIGITMVIYTVVHIINKLLNQHLIRINATDYLGEQIQVNYMYSIKPDNPLLELFWRLIPYEYWYMFLVFPIVFVYLAILYLPQILKRGKNTA